MLVRPVGDVEPNQLVLVIVPIGLFPAINALAVFIWGTDGKNLPRLFPTKTFDILGIDVTATVLCVLAILAVEAAFLFILFQRTKIGLGMRAVASTKESSSLVGIRVGWMLALGWGLAAAVGALSGILVAPIGQSPMNQYLWRYRKKGDEITEERLCAVRFVPLVRG